MSPRARRRLARIMVAGVVVLLVSAGLAVGYSETQKQHLSYNDAGDVLTFTFEDLPRPASDKAEIVAGFRGDFLQRDDDGYARVHVDGGYVGSYSGADTQCEYHELSFGFSSLLVADGTITVDVAIGPGVTFGCNDGHVRVTLRYDALPQCTDGIDNDGDGYVDYPDDPGCTSSSDNAEAEIIPTPEHVRTDLRPGCEGADTLCYGLAATILYQGDQYGALREGTPDAGVLPHTVANVPDGGATLGPDGDGDGVPAYLELSTDTHTINEDGSHSTRAGDPIRQNLDPDDRDGASPFPPLPNEGDPPPDEYQQVVLMDETVPLTSNGTETPAIDVPLARVTGGSREGNANEYALNANVLGTYIGPIYVTTQGIVDQSINVSLLHVDPVVLDTPDAVVHLRMTYTHDPAKNTCLLAYDTLCAAALPTPLGDPAWFAEEGGSSTLDIETHIEAENGETLAHERVSVPFVGQVLGASGVGS